MSDGSKIEWTEATWNPITGCDRVSPGCDNCYALTLAKRLKAMGSTKYQTDGDPRTSGPGFGVALHDDVLDAPLHWREPRKVFVNSMSDLFHARVPLTFVRRVFEVMAATPQHTYQVLTKRSLRLSRLAGDLPWPGNVWMGVSVESAEQVERIDHLATVPAAVRWVSAEPLLGPVDLAPWLWDDCPACGGIGDRWVTGSAAVGCHCYGGREPAGVLSWVVVGGESGPGARPMDLRWARYLVTECGAAEVPVFVKQLGTQWHRTAHKDPGAWPEDLRVREYPRAALPVLAGEVAR